MKAKFSYMGRDLYWKHYDLQDGMIIWSGYDDGRWWVDVSPTQRHREGKVTGRIYAINFDTDEVEIIEKVTP